MHKLKRNIKYAHVCNFSFLKLLCVTTRIHIEVRHLAHLYKAYTLIANSIYKLAIFLVSLRVDSYRHI